MILRFISCLLVIFGLGFVQIEARAEDPQSWAREFPNTDFDKHAIPYAEIDFDGARRDSIPPILDPRYASVAAIEDIGPQEPVLSFVIDGDARAYPLRLLLWHEIVNDTVGGIPVLVSYCPLCNSGVIYDRRVGDRTLTFGNTGRLRHYDMVMYDHQTESWWQQFTGTALMGELAGAEMTPLPSRVESLTLFREREPDGQVLVPSAPGLRPYGKTPYVGMDDPKKRMRTRFPYKLPVGVFGIDRVAIVGEKAWMVSLIKQKTRIESGDLVLTWTEGQNSIHDKRVIAESRDVGNVVVQRRTADGLVDVPHDVAFAFAFVAMVPGGNIHTVLTD